MAESSIGLPADGPGKKLDTESYTNATTGLVQRERMQIAGAAEAEIARILQTDPTASDHGLVIRDAALKAPKTSTATVATVTAGLTGSVDSTQLSAGVTGKLLGFIAVGSAPFKVELQLVVNAVATTRLTKYGGAGRDATWITPHRDLFTQAHDAGAGFDGFRLLFTNLDTGSSATDFHGTFLWDEV